MRKENNEGSIAKGFWNTMKV